MSTETLTTDAHGRVCLPGAFANSKIIVEQVSETELRIRKTGDVEGAEVRFLEETPIILSDRDRDRLLEALDNPPEPNEALRRAAARHIKAHG